MLAIQVQFALHPAFAYPGHPLNSWPVYTVIDPEGTTLLAVQVVPFLVHFYSQLQ